jgi:hypothetical protein
MMVHSCIKPICLGADTPTDREDIRHERLTPTDTNTSNKKCAHRMREQRTAFVACDKCHTVVVTADKQDDVIHLALDWTSFV